MSPDGKDRYRRGWDSNDIEGAKGDKDHVA
jgi:hypothetical protein